MKVILSVGLAVVVTASMILSGCSGPGSVADGHRSRSGGSANNDKGRVPPNGTAVIDGAMPIPGSEVPPDYRNSQEYNTESYDHIVENEFLDTLANPQSTFSIDVDTASYSNIRRFINDGSLPPAGAVRIEELINYFDYEYAQPESDHPFSVTLDATTCPWNEQHQLVRIGLKGREIQADRRPPSNLTFLLDVSGSMNQPNKLPLVQSAMRLLTQQLNGDDRVAIVVYAGASGLVLPSTSAANRREIQNAIEQLEAGGSTNGGEGIRLAYNVARENFIDNGINRVILCTDGDFNVGTTSQSELVRLIEQSARTGVFLSVFGFGTGNLNDSTMEKLADKGNGVYGYIDNILEAHRLLVDQVGATLITIAKDVKIQVDFNPRHVASYRLIGYENRMLSTEDFDDDTKDAGEIGAGHRVTALYEIVPQGTESPARTASSSRFVDQVIAGDANPDILLTVDLRYKMPDASSSTKFTRELSSPVITAFNQAPEDLRFATAVASFGMLLRQSDFRGAATWDWVVQTAAESLGEDRNGFRVEFVQLAKQARLMSSGSVASN